MTVAATHEATAELEGRAAAVVAAVHAVDVMAAPGTVEAVLVEVARTPHKRTRIVRHLQAHPDALTAGSSALRRLRQPAPRQHPRPGRAWLLRQLLRPRQGT